MENERFELQNVAIPLKWQLPAPKCCTLQGKRADPKTITKRKTKFPNQFRRTSHFGRMIPNISKITGPDNPTSQLLPIMSFKGCSGDGEGRKDKGCGEGSRS
jgi:hypothetical protein